MTPDPRDRLLDLLTAEATQGLSPAEGRELAGLLAAFPDVDADSLALAAAAADRALAGPPAPLPPDLATKLQRDAAAYFARPAEPPRPPRPPRPATPWYAWAGWVVAAGLAGVLVWANWPKPTTEQLIARLEKEPGTQRFAGKKDAATAEVVWNEERQEGYVKIRGLEPNDPSVSQYQLWLMDPSRGGPVAGGVFDVKPDGTALIPVRASLRVQGAQAFAVSREKPGGEPQPKGPVLLVLTKT